MIESRDFGSLIAYKFTMRKNLFALTSPKTRIAFGAVFLALFAFISFTSPTQLSAQTDTGQISGTVTDPSGATIANATVTAKNSGTGAERVEHTGGAGAFLISGLPPGDYEVTVSNEGFKAFVAQVQVTVGGHSTLDAKLAVGQGSAEVEVIAEGGAQVNTTTQELSQVVDHQQLSQMPSLTRNPYDFVVLSGNISGGDATSAGNMQNTTLRGVNFNINGQRSTGTEILLDGVENIAVFGDGVGTKVPLDGVQEFRVVTSNFEAQYGRASGGVVNVTTRAGTNAFHGNIWEFNRLSAYTSNTELNDQQNSAYLAGGGTSPVPFPKGTYTRNQFGFAVGGPIVKNKLFFFASTEWLRVRSGATISSAVPTPEFLALTTPENQAYFNAYAGSKAFNFVNTYSASDVGITGIPGGTPAFGVVSFTAPSDAGGGIPQNTYNILGRVDYNLSDKTQVFFRYVDYNELDQIGGVFASPYSQYNVGGTSKNQAYLLSASHVITPSFVENTKLSFSRFDTSNTFDTALQNVPTLFVSTNAQVPGTSIPIQLPGFYDTNPANGGLPYGGPQNTVQVNQDAQLTKGRHAMQFGAQIIYIQDNNAYGAYAQAAEQLGRNRATGLQAMIDGYGGTADAPNGDIYQFEAAVDPNGALPCVRNPYTGALTQTAGCSIDLPATSPSFARSERFHDWAVYAQDSWRATPRLTVNYGLRYEYYGVQHNNHQDLDSNYYFSGGITPTTVRAGQVFTAPNSPIHSLWAPQYGTVSPRLGFAYDIFGDGKTSFRGGWGISYERNFGNVTFNLIQNPPSYAVIVVNNTPLSTSNAGPLGGASGSVALPPTSLRNVSQNIRTAQTQFYSAAVEHQFAASTILSVQYAGARGLHLYDIKNINGAGQGNFFLGDPLIDPNPGDIPAGGVGLTRLNNQYSNINNRGSNGDSYYQAMNVQFQSNNLHHTGLSMTANYTFSHQIDDLSTTFSESNNEFGLGYTNPFNPGMDRGNGDTDIRNRFVLAPMYQTPWYTSGNGHSALMQALLGWQVTGIYTVRSGTPFNYFDTTFGQSGYFPPRYTPAAGFIPKHKFKSIPSGADGGGANFYTIGNLPAANSFFNQSWFQQTGGFAPDGTPVGLQDSDFGPYPAAMIGRNPFRGPGAWNIDAAVSKNIPIHEQISLVFRAEGFNVMNHHNLYIQEGYSDVANLQDPNNPVQFTNVPVPISASKGGIFGGVTDERRFGQFSLELQF